MDADASGAECAALSTERSRRGGGTGIAPRYRREGDRGQLGGGTAKPRGAAPEYGDSWDGETAVCRSGTRGDVGISGMGRGGDVGMGAFRDALHGDRGTWAHGDSRICGDVGMVGFGDVGMVGPGDSRT